MPPSTVPFLPMPPLGPEHARIFRITHVGNLPWILDHGLHCQTSEIKDPNFIPIGHPDLIAKRSVHPVLVPPGGTLGDYVPFYFTSHSKMFYNIVTGHGVPRQPPRDIAILVSSLPTLAQAGIPFLFTTGHAVMKESEYAADLSRLAEIDWALLRSRNFTNDPNDPGKSGRYQAEALVHKHVPLGALLGIGCYDPATASRVTEETKSRDLATKVLATPQLYF